MFACPSTLVSRGRNSRKLRFENLEARLALTGLVLPMDGGSLVDYLAQPAEMGPLPEAIPAEESIATAEDMGSDPLVGDELLTQLAVDTANPVAPLEGEGEDPPLTPLAPPLPPPLPGLAALTSFTVDHADGGWVILSGTISSSNPLGSRINFGGLFTGHFATCDATGAFTLVLQDPGYSGMVFAYLDGTASFMSDYLD
jgi:hypothetical protein